MALTDTQVRQLKGKLDARHVKTRRAEGSDLHYVEGWHVIAEANRIFGYDAWDRRTLATSCVWSGASGQRYRAAYIARVQISVRAGQITIVREGSGSGEGKAATAGQAHELALKGAETDATKRALATFGNPFGLALYDSKQAGVRKRSDARVLPKSWTLRTASGAEDTSFEKPTEFAAALRKAMKEAKDIEALFAIWEHNLDAVRVLNRCLRRDHLQKSGAAQQLVEHLKRCAASLVRPQPTSTCDGCDAASDRARPKGRSRPRIDKSVLAISEPRRIRCKEHLRLVASQPCLICGRSPSQAHHVRYAQSRGLALKVSDEFTVPLCATHHRHIHTTGNEQEWWQRQKIDPLQVARDLWQQSRGHLLAETDA